MERAPNLASFCFSNFEATETRPWRTDLKLKGSKRSDQRIASLKLWEGGRNIYNTIPQRYAPDNRKEKSQKLRHPDYVGPTQITVLSEDHTKIINSELSGRCKVTKITSTDWMQDVQRNIKESDATLIFGAKKGVTFNILNFVLCDKWSPLPPESIWSTWPSLIAATNSSGCQANENSRFTKPTMLINPRAKILDKHSAALRNFLSKNKISTLNIVLLFKNPALNERISQFLNKNLSVQPLPPPIPVLKIKKVKKNEIIPEGIFATLPRDIMREICQYSLGDNVAAVIYVCKYWRQFFLRQPAFWVRTLREFFGGSKFRIRYGYPGSHRRKTDLSIENLVLSNADNLEVLFDVTEKKIRHIQGLGGKHEVGSLISLRRALVGFYRKKKHQEESSESD